MVQDTWTSVGGRYASDASPPERTIISALNYVVSLLDLERFEEAKKLLRRTIPVAQRVLGEGNGLTLKIRSLYADALHLDPDATLNDVRESVTMIEDTARIARRVLGRAHPLTVQIIMNSLQHAQAALRARET